jgi:sterol desaturase/sphingolipid hydroxylase (fatty acid hydroxylase superfamily)
MALSFGVNWVGVLVGNLALLVIGFVWFLPKVFGDRWVAYLGRPGEQLRPGPDFILSVLSGTLNAFVMAVLALNLKAASAGDGALLGLVVFAGFFLSYLTATTVFAKRPWGLWAIDAGHALIAQIVLGVIVTLLR